MKLVTTNSTNFDSRSSGEKKKTQLAVLFTIMDFMSDSCDFENRLLFVDEIYDSLDAHGRRVVEKWICEYTKRNPHLLTFIVTHMEIENHGNSKGIIKVKKDRTHGSSYVANANSKSRIPFYT